MKTKEQIEKRIEELKKLRDTKNPHKMLKYLHELIDDTTYNLMIQELCWVLNNEE